MVGNWCLYLGSCASRKCICASHAIKVSIARTAPKYVTAIGAKASANCTQDSQQSVAAWSACMQDAMEELLAPDDQTFASAVWDLRQFGLGSALYLQEYGDVAF